MKNREGLEPGSSWDINEKTSLHSIAMSMKRIADALTVTSDAPESLFRQPINAYGETIGEAIQGQIVRGMRGIDQI